MAATITFFSQTCAPDGTGGSIRFRVGSAGGSESYSSVLWSLLGPAGGYTSDGDYEAGATFSPITSPLITVGSLPDGDFTLTATDQDGEQTTKEFNIGCGVPPTPTDPEPDELVLDSLTRTNETSAGNDGTATIQASGGVPPLTAVLPALSLSQAATAGQPNTFTNLPPGTYDVRVRSSNSAAQTVGGTVTIAAYVAPRTGCIDEYADNYDPDATTGDAEACSYTVRWRSTWGPDGVAVRVPALAGQSAAYITATLAIGFRPGHPLADARPLSEAITLRATVGPDGYATFRLAPYLWPALGAPDGAGYRLDLNSLNAFDSDVYVGYELRRETGELLEHGYAVNAAVPDAELAAAYALSPFGNRALLWPGYEYLRLPFLAQGSTFGIVGSCTLLELADATSTPSHTFPCPVNPVPVAWLAPGGGYGYWVFSGRPQLGDEVGESQAFTEPASGQRRYSQRGEARATITASSGVFSGPLFGEGLRTLWSSPQVWILRDEQWLAVTLGGGSFPLRRVGLPRTEITLTFTEATPHYAQGQ